MKAVVSAAAEKAKKKRKGKGKRGQPRNPDNGQFVAAPQILTASSSDNPAPEVEAAAVETAEGKPAVLQGRLEKLLHPQNLNKHLVRMSVHGTGGVPIDSLHEWDIKGYSEDEIRQAVAGSPHLSLTTSLIDNVKTIRPGDG